MKKNILLIVLLFLANAQLFASIPPRKGWWKFDNPAELTKAETGFGQALTLVGTQSATDGPAAGNGATLIGKGSYLKMTHGITSNGGGSYVNEYTLQFDFKVATTDVWHSFFQTSSGNANDAEFFINPSGNIGVAAVGYSGYAVVPHEWYRLLISVKNGSQFIAYLDGKPIIKGTMQDVDGRFSLESVLLLFADNDGEDADIFCSELAIWNVALSEAQASELGGYGHQVGPFMMYRVPYLQAQTTNSVTICWHDTAQADTKVEYGITEALGQSARGSSELIGDPYRWHTVKLTGLAPNTRYFYKVMSGNGISQTYSFRTLPDASYTGKLRFLILSDTHCPDSTMVMQVMKAAKNKIVTLYGADIENQINGIFHSGDVVVSGNSLAQYTSQFFYPLSAVSPYLSTMVVAGNHEGESNYFYNYLKLDEQSAFPNVAALKEKVWSTRIGNSLFIGLNTNITQQYGTDMANWLDGKLAEAENDATIDFVYMFFHHPPFSELWLSVNTFDAGANYVKNTLFPIIKKYTKVQQLHYGHTHGFERGTISSPTPQSDFRIVCGGGGGGANDPWNPNDNFDYPDIHKTFNHYFFQILEIDIAQHSYTTSMYSLGNGADVRNAELLDFWYKKKNQTQPDKPTVVQISTENNHVHLKSSVFSGADSLMTVHWQVLDAATNSVLLDTMLHRTNIYGIDENNKPVDINAGIDLYNIPINAQKIPQGKALKYKVRYRDNNLKWSDWSEPFNFTATGLKTGMYVPGKLQLHQNFPNPFSESTQIDFTLEGASQVSIRIFDANQKLISEQNEGMKAAGNHKISIDAKGFSAGMYFYQVITADEVSSLSMVKIED